ncbi:hypothetical protein QTH89_05175 [Variovorax sp. J22G21]|uniref:hypothetical protein n=1 Tax=Variovorax fucosicus TaxID=3053517 RepID=UPI0025770470|nr:MULTISPECIES: hypothetical protein [unclassified Variovorax]MDM0041537.1 hypothetical protein [Variovorax sp. J22R193]MDM0060593.1 hypothetical protein [Variovorax sp. J22G21]
MSAPISMTVTSRVESEVARTLYALPHYLPADDERILAWSDELQKAMTAGRARAFAGFAILAHLTGDLEGAERFLARAETSGFSEIEMAGARIPIFMNLGYASRALAECETLVSVERMNIGVGLPMVVGSGGLKFAAHLLARAEAAGIDLSSVRQISQIRQIAGIATRIAVPDSRFSHVLDIAGALLRKQQMFWLEESPRFTYDHEMQCVGIRYRIEVSPDEASRLNGELIDQVIGEGLTDVPLSIRFLGTAVAVETN